MSRFSMLASTYVMPLILMFLFPLAKTIEMNGEPMGVLALMVTGFLIGMAGEGFILVVFATMAILMGKLDS